MCAFPGVKLLPMFQPPKRQTINNQILYSIDYALVILLILILRNSYFICRNDFKDECYLYMQILITDASMQLLAIYLLSFYV